MCYHRITLALRYQLQALHRAQQSHSAIAKQLGIHQTSIRRELARVDPYDADSAHQHAVTAQARRHGSRLSHEVWESVVDDLRAFHSPEQIRGRAQMEGQACPSIERIYQYVYAHPNLVQYLRQGRAKRRSRTARLAPTLWASITERPEEAHLRQHIGHVEADLMEGAKGKGSLVVIEDRCSRQVTLNLVLRKTAVEVYAAMDSVLVGQYVKTITIDQGREFVLTEVLGQQWDAYTYACHAHSPWEKGSVENTNGLLRQFFPKGTDFTTVKLETVLAVQHLMNHRPRKVLGYRTPHEVHSAHQRCALAT